MTRTELLTTVLSITLLGLALTVLPPGTDAQTLDGKTFRIQAEWSADERGPATLDVATRIGVPVVVQEESLRLELVLVDRCRSERSYTARVKGRSAAAVRLTILDAETELGRWTLSGRQRGPTPLRIDETLRLQGCDAA